MNDLEQPAFDVLPSLLQLKERLRDESEGRFTAVFMTGMSASRTGLGTTIHILFPLQGCTLSACLLLDSCCGHAAFSLCTSPGCMVSASL